MSIKSLISWWSATVATLFVLIGCGASSGPTPPAFTPIQPDAPSTATPVSTASRPAGTPTPVVSDQVAISTYTHPSSRFSIGHPENWQIAERADGVVFIDPGDQAGYSVVFKDVGEVYSEEELNQYLVTFVAQNFVEEDSGFSAISQEQQADGSIVAQFASVDPNLGPAINEVRVWQQDTVVFIVMISATEEQWEISHRELQNLADTFMPLDTGPIVAATPTPEAPVWLLIGSSGNEFGFLYPSDWEILRQEEQAVTVAWPEGDFTFEAQVFDRPDTEDDPIAAAEEAALAHLKSVENEYQNVRHQPVSEFPLDTATGATIDFLFTAEDGTDMAGSVITAARDSKIYQVTFTSPAALYQGALQWFNPMYQSFKILSPEDSIITNDG